MKILSYSLFCFIFCFLGLCGDEDDCAKLEKEITVTIYSEMKVFFYAKNQEACEYAYSIDFYKDHCGGEPSGMMSYIYQGCESKYGRNYVQRKNILLWDITFTYEKDYLNINVVDSRFQGQITRSSISGQEIYELTNGGSTSFVIVVTIYDDGVNIKYQ